MRSRNGAELDKTRLSFAILSLLSADLPVFLLFPVSPPVPRRKSFSAPPRHPHLGWNDQGEEATSDSTPFSAPPVFLFLAPSLLPGSHPSSLPPLLFLLPPVPLHLTPPFSSTPAMASQGVLVSNEKLARRRTIPSPPPSSLLISAFFPRFPASPSSRLPLR